MFESESEQNRHSRNGHSRKTSRRIFLAGGAAAAGFGLLAARGLRPAAVVEASGAGKGAPGEVTVVKFSDDGKNLGKVTVAKVVKTDAEWKQQLSRNAFNIARHADTEIPYTGSTWNEHSRGIFRCICCDLALFNSQTKFDSGTGWPSFWAPIAKENVVEAIDNSLGMTRTEIRCKLCDAHQGHLFPDGPQPTGMRYCMNSGSMRFVKA